MIVKDSMVIIHLAKITLLEKSCECFKKVIIPIAVYREIIKGKEKGFEDIKIIEELIAKNKIELKEVKNKRLVEKAQDYNIQRGEAEVVALYWEERADYIATDDDHVRKKAPILNLTIIGTPAIIISLYKKQKITREKYLQSINELKKIGWFTNQIIDKMKMEVK